MSKMTDMIEQQNKVWVLIIGIVLIVYGIYFFYDMKTLEEAGSPVRMKKILEIIYQFGGKYTILGIFEAVGFICLFSGIQQLRNKL